jgi:hypothetical protein
MRRIIITVLLMIVGGGTASIGTLLILSPEASGKIIPFLNTAPPDGYLSVSSDTIVFLKWTEDTQHHLQGQLMNANTTDDPTKLSQKTIAFTGVHSGSDITLTFTLLGMQINTPGTLSGDTLTLEMQGKDGKIQTATFHAATIAQYNEALTVLQKSVKPTVAVPLLLS